MLVQEPSSSVMVMLTHHINEMGDMMGFRSVFATNNNKDDEQPRN